MLYRKGLSNSGVCRAYARFTQVSCPHRVILWLYSWRGNSLLTLSGNRNKKFITVNAISLPSEAVQSYFPNCFFTQSKYFRAYWACTLQMRLCGLPTLPRLQDRCQPGFSKETEQMTTKDHKCSGSKQHKLILTSWISNVH